MAQDDRKHTWTAKGKKFDAVTSQPGANEEDIIIKEIKRSVSMDNGTDPYGQAIDANLAVQLMASLLRKLNEANLNFAGIETQKDSANQTLSFTQEDFLRELMLLSFGMTFDKNMILKILSQPTCEGIRYYLCMKQLPQPSGTAKDFLSLIMVGVDAEGNDLHYRKDAQPLTDDNETESLTVEYAHPPTTTDENGFLDDPRLVLFGIAKSIAAKPVSN